jgi:hypothetical protein
VAVAAASPSTPHAQAQLPTSITIGNYPSQVKVNDNIDIKGQLTSGGTGLGNKLVFHDIYSANDNKWYWDWNMTTNADGSFEDQFSFTAPGTYQLAYFFHGDDQYAPCHSDPFTIAAVSS